MGIIAFIKNFIKMSATAEEINDISDYRRVQKWVKKVKKLYGVFSFFAVIGIIISVAISSSSDDMLPVFVVFLLSVFACTLTSLGCANIILYFPQVFKSIVSAGRQGYSIGDCFQTTYVNVSHEYGDNYRVTAHTESKGCLYAAIGGSLAFLVWATFCVYICPFTTAKKLKESKKRLDGASF